MRCEGRLDGRQETRLGLPRQAVEQIDIQRLDANGAQALDHPPRGLEGLDAVDQPLHHGIEILDPEAGPRHPGRRQRRDGVAGDAARVDLDGAL